MTHADIIKRLEAATGPDRELDAAIMIIIGDGPGEDWKLIKQDQPGVFKMDAGCWNKPGLIITPRPYTASLDATVALIERVLPGWEWEVGNRGAWLLKLKPYQSVTSKRAATPPLALLLAIFRALEAQEVANEHR